MKILISAGPMRTYIDPVRYIQNSSSGRLGLEIAKSLKVKFANVEISAMIGPVDSAIASQFSDVATVYRYQTCAEYETLLQQHFPVCDLFISAAAVLDFEVERSPRKISRREIEQSAELRIKKSNVPDFVAWMGHDFKRPAQKIFAFSLDTENEAHAILRAKDKVLSKNVDWIFINFASNTEGPEKPLSSGIILNGRGDITKRIPTREKTEVAGQITSFLLSEMTNKENH